MAGLYREMQEADAWYSGDESKLTAFYGLPAGDQRQPQASTWSRFWSRRYNDQNSARQRVHVPAANDIAATSADLLFGETPDLTVPEDEDDATAAQDRLLDLAEADGWGALLLEAAEVCAGIGGVYLRPAWDPQFCPHPMLTVVHADRAVPEFRWGRLYAVTFWREVAIDDKGVVWRHLERHEPGLILHGLYAGDADMLGVRRPLAEHPDTAGLAVDDEGAIVLPGGMRGLMVAHVPNVLPHAKHRGMPVGPADTAGAETLMDGLDETYTSWIRDVRLAKARILVPGEFLERNGRGRGASFDLDAEVFSPLEMDPSNMEKAGITLSQFAIRAADHEATAGKLFEQIVGHGGYSPSTFGLEGDTSVQTATEVDARQDRTMATIARKRRYWRPAIEHVAEAILVIDREVFDSKVTPVRPRLAWPDAEQDPHRIAETAELLRRAQAASTETLVRLAQPHLEGDDLAAEVARVRAEAGTAVDDPTGGLA